MHVGDASLISITATMSGFDLGNTGCDSRNKTQIFIFTFNFKLNIFYKIFFVFKFKKFN